jgi:hypothetical protein
MPTATDLVTDLPADFEVFGQAVDTRLKALQPGTTLGDIAYSSATANTNTRLPIGTNGQVLAVSGGVPAWTTTADVTPLTTKGDLFTFTTVDARLGVGANGTVLTADSAEATGLKWVPAATSGANWSLLNTGGTALTGASTVTVSGISGKDKVQVVIIDASSNIVDDFINIRFNTDTGNNYNVGVGTGATGEPWNSAGLANTDRIAIGRLESSSASAKVSGSLNVTGCNASGVKMFMHGGSGGNAASSRGYWGGGWYNSASTISSISVVASNGTLDAGTVYVFTSA